MIANRFATVICMAALLVVFLGGCSAPSAESRHGPVTAPDTEAVQLPDVPHDAIPATGIVVENWPDGSRKSERCYQDGELMNAIYLASDGTVIYEMTAEKSEVVQAASSSR